jgi:hypothetical protein
LRDQLITAETLTDLEEAGNEIAEARQNLPMPKRVSTHLSALRQIGPERPIATRDLLISKYGLTGIEQGRWVSSKESLVLLQWVADSCADLVTLPGPWFITLSRRGNIGLAIGARGRSRAAAHYEGYRRVINLTRLCGAIGLIPREHDIEGNPNVDECRQSRRKILQLVDDHQGDLPASFVAVASANPKRFHEGVFSERNSQSLADSIAKWNHSRFRVKTKILRKPPFLQQAGKLGRYWCRPRELFARAFESWCEDQLHQREMLNDYLVRGTRLSYSQCWANPYPTEAQREEIAGLMEQLIAVCRTRFEERGQTMNSMTETAD